MSGKSMGAMGCSSSGRAIDVSRLDVRIGRIVSADKVCVFVCVCVH